MATERDIVQPPALQAGKAATKALIRAAGGQEAAEPLTGRSQSRLSAYGLPSTDAFIPVDAVAALEAVTHGHVGHPHVTRWLAREAGYGLVRLPRPGAEPTKWGRLIAGLGREAGELINGVCTDIDDDNDVSREEARKRLGDAADLVRIAVELEAALKARAEARD
jgi:hypothetical protein